MFNTLLADKATDDRLRSFPDWIASRNLANEASDESVQALVDAVQGRNDIPQRWYSLKAQLLGLDRLADYDRMASVATVDAEFGWDEAPHLVLDAYGSFSPELADVAQRFFNEHWIDAPVRPGKRPGAFCAYTVPSQHPFLLLNWTSRRRDVLTLAHEMGHGLHAYLARDQGVFHQGTPLTLAETASVFGETVTFGRLLDATDEPEARLTLLAESLEGQIATVFRQIAMNRFENSVHTARREQGELSVDDFNRHWTESQAAMLGDSGRAHRGLRHVVVLRPALHRHARATSTRTRTASCSRCRCTASTRSRARRSSARTSSCSRAAARCRPRSSARSSAWTSPTRRSGTAA